MDFMNLQLHAKSMHVGKEDDVLHGKTVCSISNGGHGVEQSNAILRFSEI
jgi:hypothetical protein